MNLEVVEDKYKLNPEKWIFHKKENKSFRKYILITTFFAIGLILVSAIKNETRRLQKEISDLKFSLISVKVTLHEATLDHYYLTSPDNIDKLARKYLETDFTFYKNSQINELNIKEKTSNKIFVKEKKIFKRKSKEFSDSAKILLAQKIQKKKTEIKKLQELYSEPKKLPIKIKSGITKKIEIKKNELKKLYNEPKNTINTGRVARWSFVQLVKAFLGIPIIPGR